MPAVADDRKLKTTSGPPPPECRLKAVFLFNFAQFVEWPAEAFPEA